MPRIQKVTDPNKIVTDALILRELKRQNIDKDFVEFSQDYAPRTLGKGHSPYAKFYRDLKSNKQFMVVSGLPMVKPDGQKIEVGWNKQGNRYISKANLFSAIVEGKQVKLTCLSDQPDGTKQDEQVIWRPQLFLDGSEILNGEQPTLLSNDPINQNYKENTLEWSYGSVCKRRIRILEGRFRERWLFETNPHSSVRIKHNFAGNLKLRLGRVTDSEGNPLQVSVIGDEEIVEANEFDKAVYPVEVGDERTFYPDPHEEVSSVDGMVGHTGAELAWADLVVATGNCSYDSDDDGQLGEWPTAVQDRWTSLYRLICLFDTSSLGAGATISAAVFSFKASMKSDPENLTPDINIYSSNPASNIALADGDFNSLGSTPFCDTPIIYADWTYGVYEDFVLNAAGLAAISKVDVTKLGARNANYDVAINAPAWSSTASFYFQAYFAEKGTGYEPKLVVTGTDFEPEVETYTKTVSMDTLLEAIDSETVDLDTLLEALDSEMVNLDTLLKAIDTKTVSLSTLLKGFGIPETIDLDTLLKAIAETKTVDLDTLLVMVSSKTVDLDAILRATDTKTVDLDALLRALSVIKTIDLDAHIAARETETIDLDARLRATDTRTIDLDTLLKGFGITKTIDLDVLLRKLGVTETVDLDTLLKTIDSETIDLDAHIAARETKTIDLDTLLKAFGVTATVDLDVLLRATDLETVDLDALIVAVAFKTITLDVILIAYPEKALRYVLEIHQASTGDLIAILENAHEINYSEAINQAPTLRFDLPAEDAKAVNIIKANEIWIRDYESGTVVKKFRLSLRGDERR